MWLESAVANNHGQPRGVVVLCASTRLGHRLRRHAGPVTSSKALNALQQEVLEWIAAGTPPREWPDYTHRTTARALQNRGLVRVRGRGPTWTAEITDKGRDAITAPRTGPSEPERLHASVSELLDQLATGDGQLRVPDPSPELRAAYRRAIAATAIGQLPEGKRLRHRGRDRGDLVIELTDSADISNEPPLPIPIPDACDPDMPIIQFMQEHPDALPVSVNSRGRALRLVQALADECMRRGHRIEPNTDPPGFDLVIDGVPASFTLREETAKLTRFPDDAVAASRYDWQRISPVTVVDWNGRLVLTLHKTKWDSKHWADRQRWRLDSRLSFALEAAEDLAAERRRAQDQAEKARRERRRLWEESLPKARAAHAEAFNRARLKAQAGAHALAAQYRDYVTAVAGTADHLDDPQRTEALRWAAWIRAEADRIDPIMSPGELRFVEPVDVPTRELDEYMPPGMSASRPPD